MLPPYCLVLYEKISFVEDTCCILLGDNMKERGGENMQN